MTSRIPTEPRERQGWVLFQLKLMGESFASVGREMGVSHTSVRQALTEPSFEIEKALAAKLGVTVRQLFPERYDTKGRRLHQTRGESTLRRGSKTVAAA